MKNLIVCKRTNGKYAVRPIDWEGIWSKDGVLQDGFNSISEFQFEYDAQHYADLINAEECGTLVTLPCVAMVEQHIKDGKFDKRRTSNNGKMAVVYVDRKKWNSPLIDITSQHYNTDEAQERIKALKERENNGNL